MSGRRGGTEQNYEPDAAFPRQRQQRRVEVTVLEWGHGGLTIGVLLRFFVLDFGGIIIGDDTDQLVVLVDDRHRDVAVPQNLIRSVLARVFHMQSIDLAQHDVRQPDIRLGHDQLTQREKPQQVPLLVDNIDVVNRLATGSLVTEPFEGVGHRNVSWQ